MGDLVPLQSSGALALPDRKQQLADYEKRLKEVGGRPDAAAGNVIVAVTWL